MRARLAEVFRLEYGRLVSSVLRIVRDVDAAEEVVQDAFAQALGALAGPWLARRPGAWLLTTARRRALDRLRRARRAAARARRSPTRRCWARWTSGRVLDPEAIPDDRLRLIFTCCHPALPPDTRVASRCAWSAGSRRRRSPARSWCPSRRSPSGSCAPSGDSRARPALRGAPGGRLTARLPAVLAVIYLIFNEGYAAQPATRSCATTSAGRRSPQRDPRRAGAVRARGPGAPRPDGAPGLAGRSAHRPGRRPRPARRPGPLPLGSARIARGLASLDRAGVGDRAAPTAAGRHRRVSRARGLLGGDGLAARSSRPTGPRRGPAVAGVELNRAVAIGLADGPRPGSRPGRARWPGAARLPPVPRRPRRLSPSGSGAGRRPPASIVGRASSPTTRASGRFSRRDSRRARRAQDAERPIRGRSGPSPLELAQPGQSPGSPGHPSRHPDLFSISSGFGSAGGATVTGCSITETPGKDRAHEPLPRLG